MTYRWLSYVENALAEINSTPEGYTGSIIWMGEWCSQNKLCTDISSYIFRALGGKIS